MLRLLHAPKIDATKGPIIKAILIWELAHKDECRRLLLGDTATPCEVQSTKRAKHTCAEKEYNV